MTRQLPRAAAVSVCVLVGFTTAALAGGITVGVPIHALDASAAFERVPIAVDAAFVEIEAALLDLGVPPEALGEIRLRIDESLDQIDAFAQTLPASLPVPLLGGTVEVPLPFVVVDGLRFTGGLLSDGVIRGIARLAGTEIPQPLIDESFEAGGFAGAATIDVALTTWMVSADVVKRLDALVLALTLGGGIDWIGGRIQPLVDLTVPAEIEAAADGALAALHVDDLAWSTLAVHGVVGLEIGPPFLRLYGELRCLLPLSERTGWWGLRSGGWAAVLGMVIRF
jgi:hypothetical protein